jgi:hypothetical protein
MKIKKVKLLSFAYAYFLESGHFNGLRPIKIKNFLPFPKFPPAAVSSPFPALFCQAEPCSGAAGQSAANPIYSTTSDYRKEIESFRISSKADRRLRLGASCQLGTAASFLRR